MNKPTIPEIAPFIEMYYRMDGHSRGGSLHIVLEDENTEDHFVAWCRDFALERKDYFGAALANILLRMSRSQRTRLARRSWRTDNFWSDGGSWLWKKEGDDLPPSEIYIVPLTIRGDVVTQEWDVEGNRRTTIRFADGSITHICGDCLRYGGDLVWDEERWGYRCASAFDCFEYLQGRRNQRDGLLG